MYIYQAEVWCDACGEALREALAPPAAPEPWDSGDYPAGPYGDSEPVDSPQHCVSGPDCLDALELDSRRRVGAIVGDALTDEGMEYVREKYMDDPDGGLVVFWCEHYGITMASAGPFDSFDVAEAFVALAHDYGMYGIIDRIVHGPLHFRGNVSTDTLSPEALDVYMRHRERAARTGPYDRRLAR